MISLDALVNKLFNISLDRPTVVISVLYNLALYKINRAEIKEWIKSK